jgi:hypothetical protein
MSAQEGQTPGLGGGASQPTEEELRAAYEAELKRIKVGDVLLQTAVSLINLGGRRAGLAPDSAGERDLDQLRDAIDAVRALLPVIERSGAAELGPLRDALSQLQVAYARGQGAAGEPAAAGTTHAGGSAGADGERSAGAGARAEGAGERAEGEGGGPSEAGESPSSRPGPAESSGKLWVPGR